MQDETRIPKTARDAFLIELIGDLGIVHDQIKSLPQEINLAAAGSLELIAKSVEEAEKTASELNNGIRKQADSVKDEFKLYVKSCLDTQVKETFTELENSLNRFNSNIGKFELADTKSRRLNLILAGALILTLFISAAAMYGIYSGAQTRINELENLIINPERSTSK
ncbi:hypothetical protein [Atlantibacter hermannii]|uniref:hypothetical protein n=1 Tax=Atlantibacter hermannii TaxID=565 RepID=UPI0028A88FB9|nr:hypothetical protein [Atlantibacter hermannii]